jgi:hypothetical protein
MRRRILLGLWASGNLLVAACSSAPTAGDAEDDVSVAVSPTAMPKDNSDKSENFQQQIPQPALNTEDNLSSSAQCRDNLDKLRSDIIHILRMTPGMPPLATIYRPLRQILDDEERDYEVGDFNRCITKTERALNVSQQY